MPLRNDILRGIRAGSILLVLMLIGYAAYRVMREPAAAVDVPSPQASEAPVVAPAHAPVVEPKGGNRPVPPPPPRAGSAVRRAAPQNLTVTLPAAKVTPIETAEEKAATGISEPVAAEEERQTSLTNEPNEPVAASDADASLPAQGRGKRMMKAVGRFLHLGPRKDLTQQSIRQQ